MRIKLRKSVSADPQVWSAAQQEARRLRVSDSWIVDAALRQYLRISDAEPRKTRRCTDATQPAA